MKGYDLHMRDCSPRATMRTVGVRRQLGWPARTSWGCRLAGAAKEDDMDSDLEAERESGYAVKVGARLRSIRRQKHLSLQDVEASSEHEFKASVLGAYERGERAISVPRLQRLARFYRVPVDQMLPSDDELGIRSSGDEQIVDLTDRSR